MGVGAIEGAPSRVSFTMAHRQASLPGVRATALAVLAVLAYSETAAAEPARVTLTYARKDTTAATCPDEPTFRNLVIARLGYDPFERAADSTLAVEFRTQGAEIAGSFVLGPTAKPGEKRAQRTLRDADCFELASSLALATAIAVDPDAVRVGTSPPPTAPPPNAPPTAPPANSPPKPPTPPPPDDRAPPLWSPMSPRARITASFVLPVGLTPAPHGGVRVGVGIDGGLWSLVAEGSFLFPSSSKASFGSVTASVAYGSLVPCAGLPLHRMLRLDLCAAASVGAMFAGADDVAREDPQTHLLATVGPRAGLTLMPWSNVGFSATFDVPVNLERAHLLVDDEGQQREVWAASRVGFVGGLGLVFRVP